MRKAKKPRLDADFGPTPERLRHGGIERLDHAIADEAGRPARPYRGLDTLMQRRGTITGGMHQAAEDFRALFHRASLDPLRVPELDRIRSDTRLAEMPMSLQQVEARRKVWAALAALGGIASPAGSCIWHVVAINLRRPRDIARFGGNQSRARRTTGRHRSIDRSRRRARRSLARTIDPRRTATNQSDTPRVGAAHRLMAFAATPNPIKGVPMRLLSGLSPRARSAGLVFFSLAALPLLTAGSCSRQLQSDLANASIDIGDVVEDATAVTSEVASGILTIADNACVSAQPVLKAAQVAGVNPNDKSSVAGQLLAYGTAACDVATGQVQASALSNVNANFAYWLGNVVSTLKAAANLTVPATPTTGASSMLTRLSGREAHVVVDAGRS
jgi:hypothetical protein